MLNTKFFNVRDVVIIALVTVAVHFVAKPLYAAIDNATTATPDAS